MGGGLGMGLGWVFALLLVIGVVLVVVVVVRAARGGIGDKVTRQADAGRSGGARAILEERYARGEISTEEYRERRGELEDGS